MRYGYISNYWPENYGLISPHHLVKISLATSSYSTFVICGTMNRLEPWLRSHGNVKIALHDPFHLAAHNQPTITVELRQKFNVFFSPFQMIFRPTTEVDLSSNPNETEPALADHFRYPLIKKIIIPTDITCDQLITTLHLAKAHPHILYTSSLPSPVSLYQVGKAQLNMAQFEIVTRYRRMVIDRVWNPPSHHSNSYSESDLPPPNYVQSELAHPPLPRYSCLTIARENISMS